MSLNDPRWGRGSDDESQDKNEETGRSNDRNDERTNRDERDNRESHNNRDKNDRPEDLDRLWSEVSDLMSGFLNTGKADKERQRRNEALSKLKSRDDTSLGEDDESSDRTDPGHRIERPFSRDDAPRYTPRDDANQSGNAGNGGNGGYNGGNDDYNGDPRKSRKRKTKFELRMDIGNFGFGLLAAGLIGGWLASGFYIVPEGQTGVVTTFGRYSTSSGPGFNWHLPNPIQSVDLVDVSSVRTTQIGMRGASDRLKEALMLTDDENIVDVQFNVQYRIKSGQGARDFLFNTRGPNVSVQQAAESAMREVVGRKTMDSVLFESKAEIAEAVKRSMQTMLDRYGTGIEVMSVAIQNAQPPEQVQAAFNDAVKAGQDRERAINLGEAYMNAVIPKAQGTASRLKEEAEGYKARAVETARGDADRYNAVLTEYKKAPEVTRDRLYVDTMRGIYSNVTKVYVDQQSGSNLLYLPLDRIVSATRTQANAEAEAAVQGDVVTQSTTSSTVKPTTNTYSGAGASYQTEDDPRALVRSR